MSSFLCPKCKAGTQVRDSRPSYTGIRRRRRCGDCGHRFSTYEAVGAGPDDVTPDDVDVAPRHIETALEFSRLVARMDAADVRAVMRLSRRLAGTPS